MFVSGRRAQVEEALTLAMETMGEEGLLRKACGYALEGGKRLRPLIVLMTAEALGCGLDVMAAALSVEFFHTASLIADDLPCMDNDVDRRGRPSLHKAFGETTAVLASYTLIAAGYGGISQNAEIMQKNQRFAKEAYVRASHCLTAASRCAQRATQGQYLDLFPPNSHFATLKEIICKKTVTLFEISFLFGWLFGGGDWKALSQLQQCAYHLGMAFQIADDLEDDAKDQAERSLRQSSANISTMLGKEEAISLFRQETKSLEQTLRSLKLWTPLFQELYVALVTSGTTRTVAW